MKQPTIEILSEKGESLVRFTPEALLNFAAIQGVSAARYPGHYTLKIQYAPESAHWHNAAESYIEWPFKTEPELDEEEE